MHKDLHKLTCAHKHTFSHYRRPKLVQIDHILSYIGPANTVRPTRSSHKVSVFFWTAFPFLIFPSSAIQLEQLSSVEGKNIHVRQRTEEKHSKTKQTVMQGKGLTMAATRKHINVALGNSSTLPLV